MLKDEQILFATCRKFSFARLSMMLTSHAGAFSLFELYLHLVQFTCKFMPVVAFAQFDFLITPLANVTDCFFHSYDRPNKPMTHLERVPNQDGN